MKQNKNTLTFGHLKRGDANPFKVGDKVSAIGGAATVSYAGIGPYTELDFPYGIVKRCGWDIGGNEWADINEVYPIDAPIQSEMMEALKAAKEARPYRFGDYKVKTHIFKIGDPVAVNVPGKNHTLKRFFAAIDGNNALLFDRTGETRDQRKKCAITYAYPLNNICPWVMPTAFALTDNRNAIADNGTVTFDGITLSIEQLQTALNEAKKTIK